MSAAYGEASPSTRPAWMSRVEAELLQGHPEYFKAFAPPLGWHRRSAVLMLFAPGERGEQVVLTERAWHLRSHPGQVSFPGGSLEPGDDSILAAALRETHEEVGIAPGEVDVVLSMPPLFLTPSQQAVTPVLGWWPAPSELTVVDPAEVARAGVVPVADLVDPQHRFTVTHPLGYRGPGFEVDGFFIWGFTAMLLANLLDVAGLATEWDEDRERPLPYRLASPWTRD